VHVEKDAARHVIGLDLVIDDHLPDLGARHVGRPTCERVCNDLFQKAGVGYVIYPWECRTCLQQRSGGWL
jgi:hypothetical protein